MLKSIPFVLFLSVMSLLFVQCATTGNQTSRVGIARDSDGLNMESGKCYAKCLIGNIMEDFEEEYVVFTGDPDTENVTLQEKNLLIKPAFSEFMQIQADDNCTSPNPEDCMIWCWVEIPAVYQSITILTDTTESKNFEVQTITRTRLIKKSEFTEWRETICPSDLTPSVIRSIQEALKEKGFYNGSFKRKLDQEVKAALTDFQRSMNLPMGQLDVETLKMLKVEY